MIAAYGGRVIVGKLSTSAALVGKTLVIACIVCREKLHCRHILSIAFPSCTVMYQPMNDVNKRMSERYSLTRILHVRMKAT